MIRRAVILAALLGMLPTGIPACSSDSDRASPAPTTRTSAAPSTISNPGLEPVAIGQKAPGFQLTNQYGQPYTVQPGSDAPYLLVFHMGYF